MYRTYRTVGAPWVVTVGVVAEVVEDVASVKNNVGAVEEIIIS